MFEKLKVSVESQSGLQWHAAIRTAFRNVCFQINAFDGCVGFPAQTLQHRTN